jgi:hypothetical protein
LWKENHHAKGLGPMDFETMDFEARDFDGNGDGIIDPVKTVLDICEEMAGFRRNGSRQALLAEWRAACEAALLAAMLGPDPFEAALAGPGGVIEYLEQRGLIRIDRPSRNRRRRNGNGNAAAQGSGNVDGVVSLQTTRKQD